MRGVGGARREKQRESQLDEEVRWVGGWGGMSALLTFRGRHVRWQRGASAEEDGKAVKWKYYMRVGGGNKGGREREGVWKVERECGVCQRCGGELEGKGRKIKSFHSDVIVQM